MENKRKSSMRAYKGDKLDQSNKRPRHAALPLTINKSITGCYSTHQAISSLFGKGKAPMTFPPCKPRKLSSLESDSCFCFEHINNKEKALRIQFDRWVQSRIRLTSNVNRDEINSFLKLESKLISHGRPLSVPVLLGVNGYKILSLKARINWITELIEVRESNFHESPDPEREIQLLEHLCFVADRMEVHMNLYSVYEEELLIVGPSEICFEVL